VKAHLLYPDRDFDVAAEPVVQHDDLERDLELGVVLRAMARGDRYLFDVSRRVILASLDDVAVVRYRQAVLADCIEHEETVRELYALVIAALEDKRGIWGIRSTTSTSVLLHGAVAQLQAFVARLTQLRALADAHAEEVRSEGFKSLFDSVRRDLDDEYLDVLRKHLRQLEFRGGVLLSARLGRDATGVDYVLRSPSTTRTRWRERVGLAPRTSYSFTIPPRDEAAGNELADLTNRGLNHVANAAAQSADHVESYFTMLRLELAFYVSCLNLRAVLVERGFPLTFPELVARAPGGEPSREPGSAPGGEPSTEPDREPGSAPTSAPGGEPSTEPDREPGSAPTSAPGGEPAWSSCFSCSDLRDVSLSLQTSAPVVGNDVEADGRPLVVVTGANSGGKTTFLRSVGLAQLMAQCGMFVTASSYRSSLRSGVFTHFGREEDASMRSGRLDDELRRMDLIVDAARRGALVLFNESFSGTNEREGSEIGRQVVRALLEREMTVFFVTHLFDFADGFRRSRPETTRFLRAERATDGAPTYALVPADPLPTSFAIDVYRRIGGFEHAAGRR
jgi:hypothetical protein